MAGHALACVVVLALVCLAPSALAKPIDVDVAKVVISEADGSLTASIDVKSGEKLSQELTLDHTQTLKVSFNIESSGGKMFAAEQAFLRLSSTAVPGKAAYFSASSAEDSFEAVVSSANIEDQVGTLGGKYEASILIGASQPKVTIERSVGEVAVLHRPGPDGNQPPVSLTAFESVSKPKPEIKHMHRVPEKRAPAIISLAFTLVATVPTIVFVLAAINLGANVKGLKASNIVYAAIFHGGIGAILCVYVLFWVRLNLMQTLPVLLVLEAVTLGVGRLSASRSAGGAKQD